MYRISCFGQIQSYRSSGISPAPWGAPAGGRQSGFSLLESLVTLAILSIGLMGLAFLQAQGMQLSTGAYSRTQAAMLANDIIDRIRLNSAALSEYEVTDSSDAEGDCTYTTGMSAENDLNCWFERLEEALPGGDGTIAVNAATRVVTITVRWQQSFTGRMDPDELSDTELASVENQQFTWTVTI